MRSFFNCRSLAGALAMLTFWSLPAAPVALAQAVSPIDYGADSLADPRLGVALAAIAELADSPALLGRPSSQQFIDDAFERAARTAAGDMLVRSHVERWRDALRVTDAPFDRNAAYVAVGDLVKNVLRAAGSPRDKLISLGVLAEQTSYNARVLRDPGVDAGDRAAVGANDAADTLVPGLAGLRGELAALGAKRWGDSAAASEKLIAALLGSTFETPFPASPRVWLVLLRARPTPADATRKAEHYWLDIVRYDGTHQTLGAYPNGTNDFAHDAGRLVCSVDKEPDVASDHTIPVSPGLATTSAQLAVSLVHLCNGERTAGLHYHVQAADDDRMIADLLYRAGVNVGPILKAAAGR